MSKRKFSKREKWRQEEREARGKTTLLDKLPQPVAPTYKIDRALAAVDQVTRQAEVVSKQPRFSDNAAGIFTSVYRWVNNACGTEPDKSQVRIYDAWLRAFSLKEPYFCGVMNSVMQIDKSRGWVLTGGRNQVRAYTSILHGLDDGEGWRYYMTWQANAFYCTRFGAPSEIGREGIGGPLRTLWSIDPARCEMTGNREKPMRYYPRLGGMQEWEPDDFFRVVSMPSTDEGELGNGYPAAMRCLDLAKTMVGIFQLYKETTLIEEPAGLLTGSHITPLQWEEALQGFKEKRIADRTDTARYYLSRLMTIMSSGSDIPEFVLTLLRRLPEGFSLREWCDLLIYGYALAFGYDPREFWPVSGGTLGTGTETETQHRKASSKGDLDFSLALQEKLQGLLPATLQFEFEQRDALGERVDVDLQIAKAQVITEMTKWVVNEASVLSASQILELAAKDGIIPPEWTPVEEEATATDTEDVGESERVARACERFMDEPIIAYHWPSGVTRTLYRYGADRQARRVWRGIFPNIQRATHG